MSYNDVIPHVVVAVHASCASLALGLGAWQLWRRPKGDRAHRLVGRAWVVAMYTMLGTSFFVAPVHVTRPNVFQILAVFTLGTLTLGLRAAYRGNIAAHQGNMSGTYVGLVGAFIGAVAVPQRDIPQLAIHRPLVLTVTVLGLFMIIATVVLAASRTTPRTAESTPKPSVPVPDAG